MKSIGFHAAVFAACAMLPHSARSQVDPSGDWRTWHTDHFRVHAKAALVGHAQIVAREAERAYAALATELKPPSRKVDLVLGDDVDFSNGFATVFPSPRLTVNLAPPATTSSTGVYDSWLRLVITHELAHIFHLDRTRGLWRVLQRVFGRAPGLFPNTYQPEWVAEGIATYYESRFTAAGRLRGAYHDQILQSAARDGTWPGPGDAVRVNVAWPAGARPYAWGSRFFDTQRRLYGDSVVPRFIERTSRQLNVFRVSGAMKGAGGEPVGDAWERLRKPATTASGACHIIERGLRVNPNPRAAPDGRRFAFIRVDGVSDAHVVVRDIRSGEDISSHRVTAAEDVVWLGDTLYVTQLEYLSPVEIRSDLYRWEPGKRWERVSNGARHSSLFSAGDARVGLVSLRPGDRSVGVLRYPGTTVADFPVPLPATDWGRIAVSPDGRWVAAARHADQQWDIVLWPSGQPQLALMVTSDAAIDADPGWSYDGRQIVFSSERDGLPQLFSYDVEAGKTERLTDEPTGARHPVALGDGSIVFVTIYGDGYALLRQMTHGGASPEPGLWLEDPPAVVVPHVEARETSYSPWPALRPHFWIPLGHDEANAGFFLGALTLGADAIGRTQYGALLTAAPEQRRIEGVFYLAHKRWQRWTMEIAAGQTWDYDPFLIDGAVVPISFRERAVELGVGYQWLRWRSEAGFRVKGFVERDVLINEGVDPLPFTPANPVFAGGALSVSVSSMSRPALSISPENGASVEGVLLRRWQVDGSRFQSYEARGAISGYLALPLPGFSHWVLAATLTGGKTGGSAPTTYSVGGESGDIVELVPGTALGSGRRTFQMRAYSAVGGFTRAVVGVAELRVPVALIAKGVPGLPLFMDRVSFNLFGEVGNGWREQERANLTALRDVGGEAALDLGVGAGLTMRVRLGGAIALSDGLGSRNGDVRYYVAFGRAF